MNIEGWLANVLLIAGLWFMGRHKWWAFALTVVGEVIWVGLAASRGQWDLAVICAIFAVLAGWNLVQWRRDKRIAKAPTEDSLAALDEWCRKGYSFVIACGGFPQPGEGMSVTLKAGEREVRVNDTDTPEYENATIGDVVREALRVWHADDAIKCFRFWLHRPPDGIGAICFNLSGQIYTLDLTARSEEAARGILREIYQASGFSLSGFVPCYEIGFRKTDSADHMM